MANYIPLKAYPDSMPVDISFVFEGEKPAGKHGFLKVVGEQMQFEDGTPARFWGVNVNGGACFPDHDYAEKFTRRLSMMGINAVRFHQLDAEFGTPNVFQFSKGKHTNSRQLDERSMERLDYLVKCLKDAGIYMYLDMLTYRTFKTADGVAFANQLKPAAKPWCLMDPTLIELQKEFCTQMWNHYNPYTGLCYKDDPAFILTEIINECDLFNEFSSTQFDAPAHYNRQMREMFRDWLAENTLSYDWENGDLYSQEQTVIDFKMYLTKKYYTTMYEHMRSIGVKIPIAGTNWIVRGYDFDKAHEDLDFQDAHPYVASWSWSNGRKFYNQGISHTYHLPHLSNTPRMRLAGKPLFLSEWDMFWPNPYRAECSVYYAAVACLQGWTGCTIHTYSYNTRVSKEDPIGQEAGTPVGGSLSREGMLTTWNDWARVGLFPHAALMLRRGDLAPATEKVAVKPSDMRIHSPNAYRSALDVCQAAVSLDGSLPDGYDRVIPDTEEILSSADDQQVRISCTKELTRDLTRKQILVDTPRTKAVTGNLKAGAKLTDMTLSGKTDFGVVAISSLSDAPIRESDNMLLTAIGKVRNTDQTTEGDALVSFGKTPILAELIRAKITLTCAHPQDMKIWGINSEGSYVGQMPVTCGENTITFDIGDPEFPACYYLIFRE